MKEADLSIINQNITVDKDGKVIDAACLSKLCGAGFVCNGKSYATAQGSCCMAECVPALEKQFEGTLPFIVVAAIILGLAALVVVISTYNRVRK